MFNQHFLQVCTALVKLFINVTEGGIIPIYIDFDIYILFIYISYK